MIFLKTFLVLDFTLYYYAICDGNLQKNNKEMLPFFRRTVEETDEEESSTETKTDDPHSQLVSYLVKNVREIFSDIYTDEGESKASNVKDKSSTLNENTFSYSLATSEATDESKYRTSTEEKTTFLYRLSESDVPDVYSKKSLIGPRVTLTKKPVHFSSIDHLHFDRPSNSLPYLNMTPTPTMYNSIAKSSSKTTRSIHRVKIKENTEAREKIELLNLSKDTSPLKNVDLNGKRLSEVVSHRSHTNNSDLTADDLVSVKKRLCIYCNSVSFADCVDPKNKVMPSIICENEDDLCYSLHTPFGIIDRGCFNMKNNITTYVCSCNLCNHISISEMPKIFNEQDDWINDVIEMSNTKRLRGSVFKSMSCLKCKVNTTESIDMLNDANCVEGNIGSVPTEDCNEDEVCGIEAISRIGYIKRGCVKKPLYNYWLTLCDNDLCNYEPLVNIY